MGPPSSSIEREVDIILDAKERIPSQSVETMLNALEYHGYMKICELIDNGKYAEAEQVAGVLEKVGII